MSAEIPNLDDRANVVTRIEGLSTVGDHPLDGAIHGGSALIDRVRLQCLTLAHGGVDTILLHGEVGVGKRRIAHWLHRQGAFGPLWEVDVSGGLPELPAEPGTVVVRHLERAGIPAIRAIRHAAGAVGHRRFVLLSRAGPARLRGRSLEHHQLITACSRATLEIPPLRVRPVDIADVAQALLDEASIRFERPTRGLSPGALSRLEAHDFPGNLHELRALVEVASLRATGDWITAEAFAGLGHDSAFVAEQAGEISIRIPGASLREIELQVLRLALRLTGGRVVRAAELLGITRHALRRKLEKHDLGDLRARLPGAARDGVITSPHLREDSDPSYI
jgi:DNA-binding NtrC family response regulator